MTQQFALDFTARTTRLHRGVSTSIEAARRVSRSANTDSLFALKTIYGRSGATFKEVNAAARIHFNNPEKGVQPRLSMLEKDGYIAPLVMDGHEVKRDGCRVMVITPAGYALLKEVLHG